MKEFAEALTDEQRELLTRLHAERGWDCAAHGEGQSCCIDEILEGE